MWSWAVASETHSRLGYYSMCHGHPRPSGLPQPQSCHTATISFLCYWLQLPPLPEWPLQACLARLPSCIFNAGRCVSLAEPGLLLDPAATGAGKANAAGLLHLWVQPIVGGKWFFKMYSCIEYVGFFFSLFRNSTLQLWFIWHLHCAKHYKK